MASDTHLLVSLCLHSRLRNDICLRATAAVLTAESGAEQGHVTGSRALNEVFIRAEAIFRAPSSKQAIGSVTEHSPVDNRTINVLK